MGNRDSCDRERHDLDLDYTPGTTSNQIVSITTGGNTCSFAYYSSGQAPVLRDIMLR